MSSTKKFINLPELGRKVRALLIPHLSIDNFLFSFAILSSLFLAPYPLPAEEKQQVDSNQNNTTVSTTEGLLASTEQMIEQLIQQLELQNENPIEKAELTENPSPTSFFSSIPISDLSKDQLPVISASGYTQSTMFPFFMPESIFLCLKAQECNPRVMELSLIQAMKRDMGKKSP